MEEGKRSLLQILYNLSNILDEFVKYNTNTNLKIIEVIINNKKSVML